MAALLTLPAQARINVVGGDSPGNSGNVRCDRAPDPGRNGYATIQAAVDASGSGDEIVICSGTYPESVSVVNRSNLIIRSYTGARGDVVVDSSGDGFDVSISGSFTLRDLTVDAAQYGVRVRGGWGNHTFSNLAVTAAGNDALRIAGGNSIGLDTIVANSTGGDGVRLDDVGTVTASAVGAHGQDNGIRVESSWGHHSFSAIVATAQGGDGFTLDAGDSLTVSGIDATSAADDGIRIDNTGSISLSDTTVTAQDNGIQVSNSWGDHTFSNISVSSQADDALFVDGGNALAIQTLSADAGGDGVRTTDVGTVTGDDLTIDAQDYGIRLSNGWGNHGFSDVQITAQSRSGIRVDAGNRLDLDGVTVSQAGRRGIEVGNVWGDSEWRNLVVLNSAQEGLYIDAGTVELHDSVIENSGDRGLEIRGGNNHLIYDNCFFNVDNAYGNAWGIDYEINDNRGNYWGSWPKGSGSGFSETCSDSDSNGICDSTYDVPGDGDDDAPLTSCGLAGGPPTVGISPDTTTVFEGDTGTSTVILTVSLSEPAPGPISVEFASQDGTASAGYDYQAAAGTVSFASGEATKTVDITILADTTDEDNETFTVTLSNPSGAMLGDDTAGITIIDDDLPQLLLHYDMEQEQWSGAADEVLDVSGNNRHGTALGDATTDNQTPAIAGDPGTCHYGSFDGNGDGVIDSDAAAYLDGLGAFTIMAWIRNTDSIGNDRGVFGTDEPNGNDNRLGLRYDDRGASSGNDDLIKASVNTTTCPDGNDCLQVETESDVQVRNQWQHVAMTWERSDTIHIYVDGNEVGGMVTNSGIGINNGHVDGIDFLRLGQGVKSGEPEWQGYIDEFRIYDNMLSAAEIQSVMNEVHACLPDASLDHFVISHAGSGVTCETQPVTITAHDADHASFDLDAGTTINLGTTPAVGDWIDIGQSGGTLINLGGGQATYTFAAGGESSVTLGYQNPNPGPGEGTVNFNVDAAGVGEHSGAAASPEDGTPIDPDMVLTDVGFRFYADGAHNAIGTQVAGKRSNIGAGAQALTLRAIETNSDTGACEAALSGQHTIGFAAECRDPDACYPGSAVTVYGDGSGAAGANASGTVGSYNGIDLSFDANGTAAFDFSYSDVGRLRLHARYTLPADADTAASVLQGTSNGFVVKPHTFTLDIPSNPGATDANGPVLAKAGEGFAVTVEARGYGGALTPSFGRENAPESVRLESTLVAPAGGYDPGVVGTFGPFGEDCDGNSASAGTACGLFRWDEVGITGLTPRLEDGDYLGSGDDIVGTVNTPVGRFIPAGFDLADNGPAFAAACIPGGGASAYTYLGEEFGLATDPQLEVTPVNVLGVFTRNYAGAFWKLSDAQSNRSYSDNVGSSANFARTVNGGPALRAGDDFDTTPPVLTVSGDRFTYGRPVGALDPFPADVDLQFDPGDLTDADGVCYNPAVPHGCNIGDGDPAQGYTIASLGFQRPPGMGVDPRLRYGRGYARDAHGTYANLGDQLTLGLGAQFYDSTAAPPGWQANADDSCSVITYPAPATSDGISVAVTPASPVVLAAGRGDLTLQLTGDDANPGGAATVQPNWPAWLPGPAVASASFGIFRGDDRYLYWRE